MPIPAPADQDEEYDRLLKTYFKSAMSHAYNWWVIYPMMTHKNVRTRHLPKIVIKFLEEDEEDKYLLKLLRRRDARDGDFFTWLHERTKIFRLNI